MTSERVWTRAHAARVQITLAVERRANLIRLGVVGFKFISGTLEFLTGVVLAIVPPGVLRALVDFLVRTEVREDPHDPTVAFIQQHLAGLLSERKSIGVGLLVLGMVKIVGAIGLLRRRAWGYYLLVVALLVFLPIELVRLAGAYSDTGLLVTVGDGIVLGLLLTFRRSLIEHDTARP
jgi:uncharacterized membrane protein